ncbi:MAG: hypothetical protein COB50_05435 [Thiotrichales bacterium]|nr:MAG: hypothetical protein COB50_05435 [Thiotrichales bacterium]
MHNQEETPAVKTTLQLAKDWLKNLWEKANFKILLTVFKKWIGNLINGYSFLKTKLVEYISNTYAKLKPLVLQHKKVSLLVGSSCSVIMVILLFAGFHSASHNTRSSVINGDNQVKEVTIRNPIHYQLNDISIKLNNINKNLSKSHAYVNLDKTRNSLVALQTTINKLASSSNAMVKHQIQASTNKLQGQLHNINQQLAILNTKKSHHKSLKAESLPFSAMSIDNIQQINVVTIDYGHRIFPIEVGDAIAGWQLVKASSQAQVAEFRDKHDNYVVINLREIK